MLVFLSWQITPKTSMIMAIMGIVVSLLSGYIKYKIREKRKKIKNNKKLIK